MNLELMNDCGSETWKAYNVYLQDALTQAQAQLHTVK